MAIAPSEGKLIYHMTRIENLPSIFEKGLIPRKMLSDDEFINIADIEILRKRDLCQEKLSEYVPFHFYPRNPFDEAVCWRYGSGNMAIITVSRSICEREGYLVIPSHPLDCDTPDIYPYNEGINKVQWDILDDTKNRNYDKPAIRKACMAECIFKGIVPVEKFVYIFVTNDEAKSKILSMKIPFNSNSIKVYPSMFYNCKD